MAQSLNSKVDLTIKATSFAGLSANGETALVYVKRSVEWMKRR